MDSSQASARSFRDWPGIVRGLRSDAKLWLASGIAAGLAIGILALTHMATRPKGTSTPFQLDAKQVDGRIRLTWNTNLPLVKAATGGILEARDGSKSASYPIERKVLRQGVLEYILSSEDVLLSVTLLQKGKAGQQSVVRVVAPVLSEPPGTPAAEPQSAVTRTRMTDHPARVAKNKKAWNPYKLAKPKKKPTKHSSVP